jgi:hypothetical protein
MIDREAVQHGCDERHDELRCEFTLRAHVHDVIPQPDPHHQRSAEEQADDVREVAVAQETDDHEVVVQRDIEDDEQRQHETQVDGDAAKARCGFDMDSPIAVGLVEGADLEGHATHERREQEADDERHDKRRGAHDVDVEVKVRELDHAVLPPMRSTFTPASNNIWAASSSG